MKISDKCGVYQILCVPSGRLYVGSSVRIYGRWYQHRLALRREKSHCVVLQRAWIKYGENAFRFSLLEECDPENLQLREQSHINALKPEMNAIHADRRSALGVSARAALITRCPRGHVYDEANTFLNQGRRICRACNAERVSAIYAGMTPEERELRGRKARERYMASYVHKPRVSQKGRTLSDEVKEKVRLATKAAMARPEVAEKAKAGRKRYFSTNSAHNKGKPMLDEQKAKISAALTGRNLRPRKEPWIVDGVSRTTWYRRQRESHVAV